MLLIQRVEAVKYIFPMNRDNGNKVSDNDQIDCLQYKTKIITSGLISSPVSPCWNNSA